MSEVPQRLQHLHSIHCQRYCLTEMIILAVNCKQDGCPITKNNRKKCKTKTRGHRHKTRSTTKKHGENWAYQNVRNRRKRRVLLVDQISCSRSHHPGRNRSTAMVERGLSFPFHERQERLLDPVRYNCLLNLHKTKRQNIYYLCLCGGGEGQLTRHLIYRTTAAWNRV